MDQIKKLALLIDAENICADQVEQVIDAASQYGCITLKRAYGNWQKDELRKWPPVLKHHAIKAVQQFDYVSGKNTTDIALVIDAVSLLYQNRYDGFVIASSDSDYTPLAIHLREAGAFVMGIGEEKSLDAFRRSCDVFEVLPADVKEPEIVQTASLEPTPMPQTYDMEAIHGLLREAYTKYRHTDGYAYSSAAGMVIKEFDPSFKAKSFGYRNLQALIGAFPQKYEIRWDGIIFRYRCLEEKPGKNRNSKALLHQKAILEYLDQNGSAGRKDLDQLLSLSASATRGVLRLMVADGIIVAEGNHMKRVYKRSV